MEIDRFIFTKQFKMEQVASHEPASPSEYEE